MSKHQPKRRKVLLATTNPAKQEKLRWLLDGLGVELVRPQDIGVRVETAEEEGSHEAIAGAKAVAWAKASGVMAIASDGGLVIPSLGERWDALRTGRFAGAKAGDRERIEALLALMKSYRGEERVAYWREAVAVADGERVLASWSAESGRGRIAEQYAASKVIAGFWAFSLWVVPPFEKAYAELTVAERERVDDHWGRLRGMAGEWAGKSLG
ncbi:MAG: hypothetical protein HY261_11420 [Chloroflexi bacterium]|nr:hypothetical protein [Chloroflexota bacterium]